MVDGYNYNWTTQTYPTSLPVTEPINAINDAPSIVLINFIKAVINNYLSPSFSEETQFLGLTPGKVTYWKDGSAVGDCFTCPLSPTILQTENIKFPIISLFREREDAINMSQVNLGVTSHWLLTYVLPPLTVQGYNRLYNFLTFFTKTVTKFLWAGVDPLYQSGASVLIDANLLRPRLIGADYNPLIARNESEKIIYPMVEYRFTMDEQHTIPLSNYGPFTGIELKVEAVDSEYPVDPILISDGYLLNLQTITSLSVNTGPLSGGTPIFIYGVGFDTAVSATICGVPVSQSFFKINSNTVIMTMTSATLTASLGDVVVTFENGTQATLTNSFTYHS